KGLTDADLKNLTAVGIRSKGDFRTVGDAATLAELIHIPLTIAEKVMWWGLGPASPSSSDQVEPVEPTSHANGSNLTCFWCSSSGVGKICKKCGAELVPTEELALALLLKREGIAKEDISPKLKMLSPEEKEQLWGRVRRY